MRKEARDLCDWWKGWTSDPDRPIRTLLWLAISLSLEVLACYTGSSTLCWYFRFIHPALPPQPYIYNFTCWGFCQMISIGSLNTEVLLQFFLLNPSLPLRNPTVAVLPPQSMVLNYSPWPRPRMSFPLISLTLPDTCPSSSSGSWSLLCFHSRGESEAARMSYHLAMK